jgi:hypothetical protein
MPGEMNTSTVEGTIKSVRKSEDKIKYNADAIINSNEYIPTYENNFKNICLNNDTYDSCKKDEYENSLFEYFRSNNNLFTDHKANKILCPSKKLTTKINYWISNAIETKNAFYYIRNQISENNGNTIKNYDLKYTKGFPVIFEENDNTIEIYNGTEGEIIGFEQLSEIQQLKLSKNIYLSEKINLTIEGESVHVSPTNIIMIDENTYQVEVNDKLHTIKKENMPTNKQNNNMFIVINVENRNIYCKITSVDNIYRINGVGLSFCITTYKSQGSQWKNIYFVANNKPWGKHYNKRHCYTAITRSEDTCTIIEGWKDCFQNMARQDINIHYGNLIKN